ncbi:MAG: OB-fold nucleic acid binding domain-containing protein, partial [Fimbriimonadales bacterium]|nr:OB-fold nucleic acid binding domain-containing protein [Fimbriimonadales bacterium]
MEAQVVSVKQAYQAPIGSRLIVRGWVRSRRDSKGVSFIELNDGSRFKSLQLVVHEGVIPEELLKRVTAGACIAATGELVESPAPGQPVELRVEHLHLYGEADPATYPMQKKGHSFEFLR